MTASDILNQLNISDELTKIEAKECSGGDIPKSALESVCAFSNEPGIVSGYIILGVKRETSSDSLFPQYVVSGIDNPDKIQSDLASQCNDNFNKPIRPQIDVDQINGKNVVVVTVDELRPGQKPLFFKNQGLPSGAYRRIGPTDQRCSESDLVVFYSEHTSYDSQIVQGTSVDDVDVKSLDTYRKLRKEVNPHAAELDFDDFGLLEALNCIDRNPPHYLTFCGLIVFGSKKCLRRFYPMHRVDYIRVPSNEWVEDPDRRFTTIDYRESLMIIVSKLVDAIRSDLPSTFRSPDKHDDLQSHHQRLPDLVLRETVVNALMHRDYMENSPTQIIRYDNRIEFKNPGFSLKPEERLGEPGSQTRNPFIAAIFHDTNLAETKGSGIKVMRIKMKEAQLSPPTFESNRRDNSFNVRLLLQHLYDREQLNWLQFFSSFELSDHQKQALVFLRSVGAIDNSTLRQLSDLDTLKASQELRQLCDHELIIKKGKSRSVYYTLNQSKTSPRHQSLNETISHAGQDSAVVDSGVDQDKQNEIGNHQPKRPVSPTTDSYGLNSLANDHSTGAQDNSTEVTGHSTEAGGKSTEGRSRSRNESTQPKDNHVTDLTDNTDAQSNTDSQPGQTRQHYYNNSSSTSDLKISKPKQHDELPEKAIEILETIGKREVNVSKIEGFLLEACKEQAMTLSQLSKFLKRDRDYINRKYIKPLLINGKLEYLYPDMPNHPNQAYRTKV